MASGPPANAIQQRVWDGRLPLEILLAPSECRTYDQADPYLISYPRLCYLPFLLSRLHAFFTSSLIDPGSKPHHGWFSFEGVPLKWHYPVGLLYDLYAGAEPITSKSEVAPQHFPAALGGSGERNADEERGQVLPWRLVVHFSDWPDEDLIRLDPDGRVMHDAFINSVKEADFLRNGTAKGIMTLSKEDSDGLWNSVQEHDLQTHQRVTSLLIPPPSTPLRNLPLRIFLPSSPTPTDTDETPTPSKTTFSNPTLKVIQSPFPPTTTTTTSPPPAAGAGGTPSMTASIRPKPRSAPQTQTIGSILHDLLPTLFPSRRIPVLAKPVLHGVAVPLGTGVEDLVRCGGGYADGWVCVVVYMVG